MPAAHCVAETEDYAVVFKPPRMHCAPVKRNKGGTLLDWYAAIYPPVTELSGRKAGEGGLLHRLDFETHGLALFAKNQRALDNLLAQQEEGNFIKEYSAVCYKEQGSGIRDRSGNNYQLTGNKERSLQAKHDANKRCLQTTTLLPDTCYLLPDPQSPVPSPQSPVPSPQSLDPFLTPHSSLLTPHFSLLFPHSPFPSPHSPVLIESYFRPFGPGRKQVRPVTEANRKGKEIAADKGGCYRTEIVSATGLHDFVLFTVRLKRGFRHQVRCHLAWIGCPVANDPLYGNRPVDGFLALRACGLFFADPQSGEPREYRIGALEAHQSGEINPHE